MKAPPAPLPALLHKTLSDNRSRILAVRCPASADSEGLPERIFTGQGGGNRMMVRIECLTGGTGLRLVAGNGGLIGQGEIPVGGLEQELDDAAASSGGRLSIAAGPAELLDVERQCDIAAIIRGVGEKRGPHGGRRIVQAVMYGAWMPQRMLRHWRESRHDRSPPIDAQNVVDLPPPDRETLVAMLPVRQSENDRQRLAAALADLTAGDIRIVTHLLHLPMLEGDDSGGIERELLRLHEHGSLVDMVREACAGLDQRAVRILGCLLAFQLIRLDDDDLSCEELLLRGLVRRRASRTWEFASPTMARLLTAGGCGLPAWTRAPLEHHPLACSSAVEAYRLIFAIENLLRNTIASVLGDQLQPILQRLKAGAESRLLNHALTLKELEQATSIARAPDDRSVLGYLDTGSLKELILNRDVYLRWFSRIFPNREEFGSRFDHFNGYRRLVAHNRIVPLGALPEIEGFLDYIRGAVARAAHGDFEEAEYAPLRAEIDASPGRVVKGGVLATLSNRAGQSVRVTYEVSLTDDAGRSERAAATETLLPGATVETTVVMKVDPERLINPVVHATVTKVRPL